VNVETLRYYERRGLLARPARRPSGQREYPIEAVQLVRSIKAAQGLGFTLAEIASILRLTHKRAGRAGELRRHAESKLADIDRRSSDLERMRAALQMAIECGCDALVDCSCGRTFPLELDGQPSQSDSDRQGPEAP